MMRKYSRAIPVLLCFLLVGCQGKYTPKPTGYLKVEYPEKEYVTFDDYGPYEFEYPVYAKVLPSRSKNSEPYWYDIYFPLYDGMLHMSYKALNNDIERYIEDARKLVYKHASRSDKIEEIPIIDTANRRYGILYELGGDVASSIQFFLTDSTEHFIRGSLYFNTTPNKDSLNPIINYVGDDIEHMIETVRWK